MTRKTNQCFNVTVENTLKIPTSLHWHGLILPWDQDGTSYVSQLPIPAGGSQSYNFKIQQTGTYYAHAHYGLEEQKLLSIPLIIQPEVENKAYKEIIVYLEDFTFETIENVWGDLREDLLKQKAIMGRNWLPDLSVNNSSHAMHDLADVVFDAYLANKKTVSNPDIHKVASGDEVILRFINASISSQFNITLGGLKGKIIATDGNPVVPMITEEFPLATGQRIDIRAVIPKKGSNYPILAHAQGSDMQTGIILAKDENKVPIILPKSSKPMDPVSNNTEKFLYAKNPLAKKAIDQSITLELEGNMMYYVWAINGQIWPKVKPLKVTQGQRVELVFVNKTTMSHPMHLHGHVFQVTEIDGLKVEGALRDTILVMPSQVVKVVFDANNPGTWDLHCHVGYHAWGGMATVLQYEGYEGLEIPMSTFMQYSQMYGGY